jgi:cell division transport system permease protein
MIGVLLTGLSMAVFMQFVVYERLRQNSHVMEWVTWSDGAMAFVWIAVLGVALTLVPTLVMTRKYLKV